MVPSARSMPPTFVRLASHPLRWRLMAELAASDLRVRELVGLVDEPQSLVSYHLRLLRGSGLVSAGRSSFDGRDTYYHLDLDRCAEELAGVGAALHPALRPVLHSDGHRLPAPALGQSQPAVLFACTGNSARSPIAEALLRHRTGSRVDVTSAGSRPRSQVHPHVVRVLHDDYDIDLPTRQTRHLDALTGSRYDVVVTLCDKVREVCPDFAGRPQLIHWSIPDPAADRDDADSYPAFRRTAAAISARIRHLVPVLAPTQEVPS